MAESALHGRNSDGVPVKSIGSGAAARRPGSRPPSASVPGLAGHADPHSAGLLLSELPGPMPRRPLEDGINQLPRGAGIYCVLNRVTGRRYIGQAVNVYRRCLAHRSELRDGRPANMLMRRDLVLHGFDPFFFVLAPIRPEAVGLRLGGDQVEHWWAVRLQAIDEFNGYNLEAGRRRTKGSLLRDREVKLMRPTSRKYVLLGGVDLYDPIHPDLLGTWVRGS